MMSVKMSEYQEGSSDEDSQFIELKEEPCEDLTFLANPVLVERPRSVVDGPLDPDICHSIFGLEGCVTAEIVEVLPEIKEEDILSKFHFEDKDLTVVDEADVQRGEKKILVRQNVDGFCCPLFCNFMCTEQSRMVTHLLNHRKRILTNTSDNEITFICPLCPSQFVMHTAFVVHIANHKKVPNLVCRYSVCSVAQPTLTALKIHIAKRHSQMFRCTLCPFRSRNTKTFNHHLKKCSYRTSKPLLQCHFSPCPFETCSLQSLKTHEWIQHQVASSKVKSYRCEAELCNFETCQVALLNVHKQLHAGEEMLCSLCFFRTFKFFIFRDHLLEHINSL